MRSFPRRLGLLGTALILSAAPALAQQPACPDMDRLDQRIAALESATLTPPASPAEIGALRALRQSAERLARNGNAEACTARVHSGLAMARSIEAPHALSEDGLEEIRLFGAQGENIGSIEDVLFDPVSGRIAYAVVEMGGFLGLGERKMPVPWAAFTANPNGAGLVLNLTKDRLKGAPQFGGSQKASVADRQWALAVHAYYGVAPYWMQDAAALPPAEAATASGASGSATVGTGGTGGAQQSPAQSPAQSPPPSPAAPQ